MKAIPDRLLQEASSPRCSRLRKELEDGCESRLGIVVSVEEQRVVPFAPRVL